MNKKQKQLIIVFIAVAVMLTALYFLFMKNDKDDSSKTWQIPINPNTGSGSNANIGSSSSTGSGSNASSSTPSIDPASGTPFPLKEGMRGLYVKALQKGLNAEFAAGLNPDGIFGPKTKAAVEKYLDPNYALKPSKVGVAWSVFLARKYDKYL
jgi:hypothetical protein